MTVGKDAIGGMINSGESSITAPRALSLEASEGLRAFAMLNVDFRDMSRAQIREEEDLHTRMISEHPVATEQLAS